LEAEVVASGDTSRASNDVEDGTTWPREGNYHVKKIRIFGPVAEGALESLDAFFETIQTPAGFPCKYCQELFKEKDAGVVLPFGKAAHKHCYLTNGLKSVNGAKEIK
jgi:hypothetical protein